METRVVKLFSLDLAEYSLVELRFLKEKMDFGCDKPEPEQAQFYAYFQARAAVAADLQLQRYVHDVFREAFRK